MIAAARLSEAALNRLQAAFLKLAREAVDRAKELRTDPSGERLVYAALELRRAFEALVYENALRFFDELDDEDILIWQPHRLLERLIEIDPVADATMKMSIQDPASGEWIKLGTDQRISLKGLRNNYFALGNFLHTPSLAQMLKQRTRKPDALAKLCSRCIEQIETDLGATMRIGRFAIFGHVDIACEGCGARVRQRLNALRMPGNGAPGTKEAIQAKCSNCPASYEIRSDGSDGVMWRAQHWEAECPFEGCEGLHTKWTRELKDGMISTCPACGRNSVFTKAFTFIPEPVLKRIRR